MRTLKTAVCTLEPQWAEHAAAMFAVLSDPAIYEFENAPPASEAWLRDRFARLEARQSPDGAQLWLNWVVRLPTGELAGYLQATVIADNVSFVAYELASRFWRRGIGSAAVTAMAEELVSGYGVRTLVAVLKSGNFRSLGLVQHLGFTPASAAQALAWGAEPDERVMVRFAASAAPAGVPGADRDGNAERHPGERVPAAVADQRGEQADDGEHAEQGRDAPEARAPAGDGAH